MNHCNCWNKAPTVPVFREDTKHPDDCPAKDSGQKVGVNPQLGNYIVEGEDGVFYEFPANSEEKAARLSLEESAIVRQSIADQDARIVELEAKVESLRAELSQAQNIANADSLWKLVHLVQDTIDKDGSALLVGMDNKYETALALLRKLADELDPENGRY